MSSSCLSHPSRRSRAGSWQWQCHPHQPFSCQSQRCPAWPSPASVSAASPACPRSRTAALAPPRCQGGEGGVHLPENSSEQEAPPASRESSRFPLLLFPAPALLSTNLPLPAPTPGGSAIAVGDLNPTKVSFLREQCSDFLSSNSNHF